MVSVVKNQLIVLLYYIHVGQGGNLFKWLMNKYRKRNRNRNRNLNVIGYHNKVTQMAK